MIKTNIHKQIIIKQKELDSLIRTKQHATMLYLLTRLQNYLFIHSKKKNKKNAKLSLKLLISVYEMYDGGHEFNENTRVLPL